MLLDRARRLLGPLLTVVLCIGPLAATAAAQDDKVYPVAELSNPPKLSSTSTAARLIQESYPDELRRRGVGGLVEVQFVVDGKGKVDPATVEVVDATQSALGEAAKKVVTRLEFVPGKLNGSSVRSRVVLPIVYKAQ